MGVLKSKQLRLDRPLVINRRFTENVFDEWQEIICRVLWANQLSQLVNTGRQGAACPMAAPLDQLLVYLAEAWPLLGPVDENYRWNIEGGLMQHLIFACIVDCLYKEVQNVIVWLLKCGDDLPDVLEGPLSHSLVEWVFQQSIVYCAELLARLLNADATS